MTIQALTIRNLRARNRSGGDCVVLALTFITGISYLDVEDYIKDNQSRYMRLEGLRAHGVNVNRLLKQETQIFGWKFTCLPTKRQDLYTFMESNPNGTFLVTVPGHALVVKDGVRFCGNDTSVSRVLDGVWKAEKL